MPSGKLSWGAAEFLHKALGNFKAICSRDYGKLRKTRMFGPFSCSGRWPEESQSHKPYANIYDEKEYEFQKTKLGDKNNALPEESSTAQETTYASPNPRKKKQKKGPCLRKGKEQISIEETKRRDDGLARKMENYNMMDLGDVDHVLDIREALCCYSMIRSPVYIDIVDNFFMDMYHEFSDPHTSSSINSLTDKAGSFRNKQAGLDSRTSQAKR